jgi:hypothetical protein
VTSPPGAGDLSAQIGLARQDAAAALTRLRMAAQKLAADKATDKVGKPLLSMIEAAGADLDKLRKGIEDWFNSAMDRVSGWYRARTQKILFVIGLALAVALNADALRIVKQLSTDTTLRQSIVAAAQSAKPADSTGGQTIDQQIAKVQGQVSKIKELGIPFGWDDKSPDLGDWQVYAGWLLTAFAASLGAPFWFDILGKIMVVRSTIKPTEPGQKEGQSNPKQTQTAS